jgi:hypothetical protein
LAEAGKDFAVTSVDQSAARIPTLKRDGSWIEWSRKFRALSLQNPPQDKWLSASPTAGSADEAEDKRHDAAVKSRMTLAVSGDLVSIVDNASTSKDAFNGLQLACVRAEQVRRSVLMSNVEKLSQAQTESIEQYVNRSRDLMTEARDLEAVASAEQLCLKIVCGLLPHHKHAVGSTILASIN